ncbi:MAG: GIY-YIG nuclease family protein [Thermoplasmata archaeon]
MWYLYILRLSDDSLYTGITKDVDRRIDQHEDGDGSKYVRSRLPCKLVYLEELESRSEASRREAEIKSWDKERKEELVS